MKIDFFSACQSCVNKFYTIFWFLHVFQSNVYMTVYLNLKVLTDEMVFVCQVYLRLERRGLVRCCKMNLFAKIEKNNTPIFARMQWLFQFLYQ